MTVDETAPFPSSDEALRSAVRFVALANLVYFGVEFAIALAIGSVALFADSIDFLEDTALNLLILIGLGLVGCLAWTPGHDPGGHPFDPQPGDSLEGVGEIFPSCAA